MNSLERRVAMMALLATAPMQIMAERKTIAENEICIDRAPDRAQMQSADEIDYRCLLIGAGHLSGESEYLSDDLSDVLPVVYLAYGNFYWDTTEIGYYFLGEENAGDYWGIAALLELPSDGFNAGKEDHLADLRDRDPTLEGGFNLVTGGVWGDFELGLNVDLEDEHEGYTVHANYGYPLKFGNLTVTPEVSWKYRDEKNGNYYYGVDADEAGPAGRIVYAVDASTSTLELGYSMSLVFNSHWSLFHSLEVRYLDDLLHDSPLTVNEDPAVASFGLLYRFF